MHSDQYSLAKVQEMKEFFENLRVALPLKQQRESLLPSLGNFFQKLAGFLPPRTKPSIPPEYTHLSDLEALKKWLESDIAEPLLAARHGGFLCDPWEIAGLKRDEVRNSRVLAWLFDPRGNHGFGDLFLSALLVEIDRRSPMLALPKFPHEGCRVRVESSPDGDSSNRLDIEVDAPNFYLIIEVKIDATEGREQLLRYGDVGLARAKGRPWGIVFLTPKGAISHTAAHYTDRVTLLPWGNLSSVLARSLHAHHAQKSQARSHEKLTYFLAKRFLQHVRNF